MIIKATLEHLEGVVNITKDIVIEMKENNLCQWNETYPNRQVFEKDINNGHMFVYLENSEVLGYIVINEQESSEYNELYWPKGKFLVIHRTGVSINHRNKGIASKLFTFAEEYAKENGYNFIKSDTFSKNHKMRANFLRRGYTHTGDVFFNDAAIEEPHIPFSCYYKEL